MDCVLTIRLVAFAQNKRALRFFEKNVYEKVRSVG